MTAIAQRRVAGATALLILLYLLQVALISTPASADDSPTHSTGECAAGGNNYSSFEFNFVNGTTISGDNCVGSKWHVEGDGGGQNAMFRGADGHDDFVDGQTTGMLVHVSCSDVFEDGWGTAGGPNAVTDSNWEIASYSIFKWHKGNAAPHTSCIEVFQEGLASVSVSTGCVDDEFVLSWTTEDSSIEFWTNDGALNPVNGASLDLPLGTQVFWEATADADHDFANAGDTESGSFVVTSCTDASVTVGTECRDGTPYFTVSALVNATLTVDLDGNGSEETAASVGAWALTADAGDEVGWTATALGNALFGNQESETSGTVTVPTCPTTTTGGTTTTQQVTTTTQPPTTTTATVLGTTIVAETTVPEVSAETLPFTGSASDDVARFGLLALLAGALMLFAARGRKEEEEIATDMGGWSSL